MMLLQGYPIDDMPYAIEATQHQLSDLAGNRLLSKQIKAEQSRDMCCAVYSFSLVRIRES